MACIGVLSLGRRPKAAFALSPQERGEGENYFHTDLSASQRWPFNSLVSAGIEPLSSSGSAPSSSDALEPSARLSFGPAPSSAVVVDGLDTHSISLSDAP